MSVTVKQVFDAALVLIDEVLENGNIVADQPKYYQSKSLSILTSLQAELLPITETPPILKSLTDVLALSDRVCLTVLPYGLAAHLLIQDDPNSASFYNARYEELRKKTPTTITRITDIYDVTGGMS